VRIQQSWSLLMRLARQGVALALSLVVLLPNTSTALIPSTVHEPRAHARLPLLVVLPPEDPTDNELPRVAAGTCAPTLTNAATFSARTRAVCGWVRDQVPCTLLTAGLFPRPDRAPPA
jgi:hypothetical protein